MARYWLKRCKRTSFVTVDMRTIKVPQDSAGWSLRRLWRWKEWQASLMCQLQYPAGTEAWKLARFGTQEDTTCLMRGGEEKRDLACVAFGI